MARRKTWTPPALDDVMDFFRRFYAPSNASLAIAGDIDTGEALGLAERYFADLDPGPAVRRIARGGLSPGGPR